MNIYWIETRYIKRHRKEAKQLSMKGFHSIVDRLVDKTNFEVSYANIARIGRHFCMKLGNTTKTPKSMWVKYLKKLRNAYPPLKLASKEVILQASSLIVSIIKSSKEFSNIVQVYLKY